MLLIDSHCHLDLLQELNKNSKNINDLMKKTKKNHVKKMLSVCISITKFYNMIHLFNNISDIYFSFGVHPLYIDNLYSKQVLYSFANRKDVIAIGETGLDYSNIIYDQKIQKKVFIDHIQISKITKKPLIVHSRNSIVDTIKILSSSNIEKSGCIIHCFTENIKIAKIFLDLGCYISFSGIVTFKNAKIVQDSARYVPDDRILIETDSPYLAPEPYRGKTNEPAYLLEIAKFIAKLRCTTLENFAKNTTKNFQTLFPTTRI
ncbi:MAG: putative metallodependent hydrolase [Wigglesworthia glossinidia]|nr:putative metallodependent hydrolase [Wigglesworthia glossinidia]